MLVLYQSYLENIHPFWRSQKTVCIINVTWHLIRTLPCLYEQALFHGVIHWQWNAIEWVLCIRRLLNSQWILLFLKFEHSFVKIILIIEKAFRDDLMRQDKIVVPTLQTWPGIHWNPGRLSTKRTPENVEHVWAVFRRNWL